MDNDKIINACNNIVYYIVNPALRGKTRCGLLSSHNIVLTRF